MSTQTATVDEVTPIAPTPQPLPMADAGVIHDAIMDVIDAGNTAVGIAAIPWDFNHPFAAVADSQRMDFCDAVEKRIRELQAEPHNLGVKLENYCPRHMRARLPRPTASVCADCNVG